MLLGDLIGADGPVMPEANCNIPALRTCYSRRLGSGRCEPTLSMKALLGHHPLKADQGLPRPVALQAQEASLEKALTELLLQLISQGHSGQQLACGGDALTHILLEDSVLHLSVTSKDHQEHKQEGPATHMLIQ